MAILANNFKFTELNMIKGFNSLQEFQKAFGTELKCIKQIIQLRWGGALTCPRCGCVKTSKYAKVGLFWCSACKKPFSVKLKTIFEDSALPLTKWFLAIYLEVSRPKGISSCQLAKDIKVGQDTAWFMLQRIRWALAHNTIEKMDGDVCVDETFVGGKEGNKHVSKRKPKLLVVETKNGCGWHASKTKLVMKRINKLNIKHINPVLEKHIDLENATLHTDESPLYKRYQREVVCHSRGEYSKNGKGTNRIEGVFSHFKRMVFGVFHQISATHIDNYIGCFVWRWNCRHVDQNQSLL